MLFRNFRKQQKPELFDLVFGFSFRHYLDFFDNMVIQSIWISCNRRGFFSWRQEHLDKLLSEEFKNSEYFTDSAIFDQLDHYVEDKANRAFMIYHWLELFENRGESMRRPMKLLREWLYERKSSEAFHVAADIISIGGIRSDLEILNIDIPNIDQIREDTTFAVKLRTLQ